ncbi:MAG: sodium:calcium antiporter [Lautropia sp.]
MPTSQSLLVNLAIFAVAAVCVWLAGWRIAGCAAEIARRSGLGEALMGLLLLAGVTSLPEIATSFTAALSDDPRLAVNNLLGSIAMQVAVLAVADAFIDDRALTSVVPDPVVMLQGGLNVALLAVVAIATLVGDVLVAGAGVWSWSLLLAAAYAFWKLSRVGDRRPWVVPDGSLPRRIAPEVGEGSGASHARLTLKTVGFALVILAAGTVVAASGSAIAEQSGLGASFVGVAFVAVATSLPEASTVFASVRRGLYTMAISDILGTNVLNVALIAAVDLLAPGAPVLSRAGAFATVATLLGILVTSLFMIGLAERRDRTVWRMGIDSAAVLVVYLGGMVLLFTLREAG